MREKTEAQQSGVPRIIVSKRIVYLSRNLGPSAFWDVKADGSLVGTFDTFESAAECADRLRAGDSRMMELHWSHIED